MARKKPDQNAPKNKGGAPTSYKPEYVRIAKAMAKCGATDREIGEELGVTERCVTNWKNRHPEFAEALRVGKEHADDRVEQSLYRSAIGYKFDAEKITVDAKTGKVTRTPYVEHVHPNVVAQIFWLKNRRRDAWRDKVEHEHSGEVKASIKYESDFGAVAPPAKLPKAKPK